MLLTSLNLNVFQANNKEIREFLKSYPSDIVCLNEVIKPVDNTAFEKYNSYSAVRNSLTNLTYDFFAPKLVMDRFYAKNFHGKKLFEHKFGGFVEYGNQIYSKYKVLSGEVFWVQGNFEYYSNWDNFPEDDSRNVQVVDLEIEKNIKLRVINYHGIWSKNKRGNNETLKACRIINKLGSEVDGPAIISGDFNLFPDTESMQVFSENYISLVDKYNINTTRLETNELSDKKRNIVDYILITKDIKVNDFKVIKSKMTDHLPLWMDFKV